MTRGTYRFENEPMAGEITASAVRQSLAARARAPDPPGPHAGRRPDLQRRATSPSMFQFPQRRDARAAHPRSARNPSGTIPGMEDEARRRRREEARRRVFRRRRLVAAGIAGRRRMCSWPAGCSRSAATGATTSRGQVAAEAAELPRGGRTILPDFRVVAYYGAPQDDELGILGIGPPRARGAAARAPGQALRAPAPARAAGVRADRRDRDQRGRRRRRPLDAPGRHDHPPLPARGARAPDAPPARHPARLRAFLQEAKALEHWLQASRTWGSRSIPSGA